MGGEFIITLPLASARPIPDRARHGPPRPDCPSLSVYAGICEFAMDTPPINLSGHDIPAPGDLAYRRPLRKGLRDDRPLLLGAPAPAPLRTRQNLNSAHCTVSCTGASNSACTAANQDGSQQIGYRPRLQSRKPMALMAAQVPSRNSNSWKTTTAVETARSSGGKFISSLPRV